MVVFQRLILVFQKSLLKSVLKWLKNAFEITVSGKLEFVKSVVEK